MDLKKELTLRAMIAYVGMIFFGLAIMSRIAYLQFVEGDMWAQKARSYSQRDQVVEARRGDILAHDGRLLASSVPFYDLYFDTHAEAITDELFRTKIDSLSWGLATVLGTKTEREFRQYLVSGRINKRRYLPIKRNATYIEMKKISHMPIFREGKYKGGLIIEPKDKRTKPFVELASRSIGYMVENNAGEKVGFVGLERSYEHILRGRKGIRLMQKLSGGNWMPVNNGQQVDPIDGQSLVTSLDVSLQDVAHSALLRALVRNEAKSGCAVLMETKTGEIRAAVNLELGEEGSYHESFNFAVGGLSEPGSTFKLISLLVALEEGVVKLDDSVDTENGSTMFFDRKMKDSHPQGGIITVRKAFEISSNVGISKIINEHYYHRKQYFANKLYQMGVNVKLGVDLIGEPEPDLKDVKKWSGTTLPWMSIGYEVQLTPLQILAFYNAIANDGKMVKPHFVKAVQVNGKIVKTYGTEVLHPMICSKATVKMAQELLEGVVQNVTARNIKSANYRIAGKTGTSQVDYGKAQALKHQASFVGYFPADNPRYSCIVIVADPTKGRIYGGDVAAPVFKEIADKVYASNLELALESQKLVPQKSVPYCRNGFRNDLQTIFDVLDLPVKENNLMTDWVFTTSQDSLIGIGNRSIDSRYVPNVKGMGLRDALFLLENAGMRVTAIGVGAVRKQSIEPGAPIVKGKHIIIELG